MKLLKQTTAGYSGNYSLADSVDRIVAKLPTDKKTLWWIDSADVQSTRQIIQIAEARGDDIHIGQSTSTGLQRRVSESTGWLGTTLAEATGHSQLVITLGSEVETELPQLGKQLTRAESTWIHLGEWRCEPVKPDYVIPVAVSDLYALLTEVLLRLRYESLSQRDADSQLLYSAITESDYTTVLWSADQFNDDIDELTLRRLVAISHLVSQTQRLCLLPIEANPGRVTASETLSWLTGYTPSVSLHDGQCRSQVERAAWPLERFRKAFRCIVMLRSVAAAAPLPRVNADVSIVPAGFTESAQGEVVEVTSVGLGAAGHLMRGDAALTVFHDGTFDDVSGTSSNERIAGPPSAIELLSELRHRIQLSTGAHTHRSGAVELGGGRR